jgi:hypothetical protein
MKFNSALKIYLFKETEMVSFSIKVSSNHVLTFRFLQDEFEQILEKWDSHNGIELETAIGKWEFRYKKAGPRPEQAPNRFVKIALYDAHREQHFRVSYDDMQQLRKEYFYQKHKPQHWDRHG